MASVTVTVGCKLPHGIHMDVAGKRITLNGANTSNVIGGHGITENVDKEFFDKWKDMHKESPMIKNELIFAHDKADSAKAQAKANEGNETGFEGINPDKPGNGVQPVKEEK
jgi:hypothetical protein